MFHPIFYFCHSADLAHLCHALMAQQKTTVALALENANDTFTKLGQYVGRELPTLVLFLHRFYDGGG